MLFAELAQTSVAVAETRARSAKIDLLATCLGGLRPDEVPAAMRFLSGTLPRIGVGWAALRDLPTPAAVATLEILDVDRALERIASTSGRGSQATRRRALEEVFALATEPEQRFLRGILHGELRQGALEGVMVEAVARAAEVPAAAVRRALMLAGELPPVAGAAFAEGAEGLARFRLEVLRPVKPMLAQTAEDVATAIDRTGRRGGGVEARRRAAAGAPPRRRGARVHEEPRRRHRPRAGDRRRGPRVAGRGAWSSTGR